MSVEAKRYRALANGARKLADRASTEGEKQALSEAANKYDQLADAADQASA
jgi:hypothetical protein